MITDLVDGIATNKPTMAIKAQISTVLPERNSEKLYMNAKILAKNKIQVILNVKAISSQFLSIVISIVLSLPATGRTFTL
jgi:hypothetical protein